MYLNLKFKINLINNSKNSTLTFNNGMNIIIFLCRKEARYFFFLGSHKNWWWKCNVTRSLAIIGGGETRLSDDEREPIFMIYGRTKTNIWFGVLMYL